MSFTREIDLFGADGDFVRSLKAWVGDASFTLTGNGGSAGGSLVIAENWRDRFLSDIQDGMEVRFRWNTSAPYCYTGIVRRPQSAADHRLRVELAGSAVLLDGILATSGEAGARVDFGSSATIHPEITTCKGIAEHYLSIIAATTNLTFDADEIEDDGQTVDRVEWTDSQTVRRVLDDLAMYMGAAGQIYRWAVIPGEAADDPNRIILKRVDALTDIAGTFTIGLAGTGLDVVSSVTETRGALFHNSIVLRGGINRGADPPALTRITYENASSIATNGRRQTRLRKSSAVTETMATRYAQGYAARYDNPQRERTYSDIMAIPSEETTVPLPWAGKLTFADHQTGEIQTEEFIECEVAWNHHPTLRLTLGRFTKPDFLSEADGSVASPNNLAYEAFFNKLDLLEDVLDDAIILPLDTPGGGAGLPLGTLIPIPQTRFVEQGQRAMWYVMVAHKGDRTELGNVGVEYAFRAEDSSSWSATANAAPILPSNTVGDDERFDQRVGPRSAGGADLGPSHSSVGTVGFRFTAYGDDNSTVLFQSPESTDPDDWHHLEVVSLTIVNEYTITNNFVGVYTN